MISADRGSCVCSIGGAKKKESLLAIGAMGLGPALVVYFIREGEFSAFHWAKKKERKQAPQGRDGRTARRHPHRDFNSFGSRSA